MKKIMKFFLFFSFFIVTGTAFFYFLSYFDLPFNIPKRIEGVYFYLPLWIINIIGGFIIGHCLKLFSLKNKGEIIAWIFLGCVLSHVMWYCVFLINFSITMSAF